MLILWGIPKRHCHSDILQLNGGECAWAIECHLWESNRVEGYCCNRLKIRLIESNAKCHHLRYPITLTCKGTLRQAFYLSEDPSPPMTPYRPLHTVYVYIVYLFTQGGWGERGNQREGKCRR